MASSSDIYEQLQVEVIEPIGTHKSTLIWMHGLGDSSKGFLSMFRNMAPKNTKIVLPNAPKRSITVSNGRVMRAWYDIKSFTDRSEEKQDQEGIHQSASLLHQLLDREFSYTDKVVCGGFSQGGSMTLAGCLSYETHKLEALIIASGIALLGKSLLGSRYKNMQDNVPIYIFHGEVDRVIQYQHAMKSFAELVERRGDKVQIFTEPNQGHEITDSEYLKLVELITKHCAN